MRTLSRRLPTRATVDGKRYRLHTGYARVLEAYDTLERKDWTDPEKISHCVWLLYKGPKRPKISYDAVIEALRVLCPADDKKPVEQAPKCMDFHVDADMIYAAFWQTYGIRLQEVRDSLHIQEFLALMSALPSDTRFSEIVRLRTMEVPKPDKGNTKQRAEIIRLKRKYALPVSEEEQQKHFQRSMQQMAGALMAMAKAKKDKQ